jgi:hypothetical protein
MSQPPSSSITHYISKSLETKQPLEVIFTEDLVNRLNISWHAIQACCSQFMSYRTRRNAKFHRTRSIQYLNSYLQGEQSNIKIIDIARAYDHSPWLLAKEIVILLTPNSDTAKGKKLVQESLRDLDLIENERLRRNVKQCMEEDPLYSPYHDRARRAAGLQYEYKLQRELIMLGIAFETEEALRRRGFSKTPDVLLILPIAITLTTTSNSLANNNNNNNQPADRVVRWIDSKAMYGDLVTHNDENREQLQSYVNRFGPGLVIYWMGFDPDIQQTYPDVTVEDHLPREFISLL